MQNKKKRRKAKRKTDEAGDAKSGQADEEDLAAAYDTDTHKMQKRELSEKFNVDFEVGIRENQISDIRDQWGYNRLTPAKTEPAWARLLRHIIGINALMICNCKKFVDNFFNLLLWVGAILCFFAYGMDPNEVKDPVNLYLGIVLSVVVTISGIFGFFQEGKSSDIMGQFAQLENQPVVTLRESTKIDLDPDDLLPGDVIDLKMGDRVPADVRFIHCTGDCEVNNASLTGESEPQKRKYAISTDEVMEAKNLAFFGTYIVKGKGVAVVIKIGDETFMGKIAKLAQSAEADATPIAKEIKDFIFKISGIAFTLGAVFFIFGMVENGDFVRNMIFLIAIIVANVPEGLLMTVTVSLTLTATRMREKNVQVKRLESVETLGSTSVICSDKTGTLTTSKMTVASTYWERVAVTANTVDGEACNDMPGQRSYFNNGGPNGLEPSFQRLLRVANLNNTCQIVEGKIKGDSTETAITKFCQAHASKAWGMGFQKYKDTNKVVHAIPFNSGNKWQVTIHQVQKDDRTNQAVLTVKGAAERVLLMCDEYLENGRGVRMTDEDREHFMDAVTQLGKEGQRVLAFADLELDMDKFDLNTENPRVPRCDETQRANNGQSMIFVVGPDGQTTELVSHDVRKVDGSEFDNFLDITGMDIKQTMARKLDLVAGKIRLYYDNAFLGNVEGDNNADDQSLNDMQLSEGVVLYYDLGKFVFSGDSRDNANWPFARNMPDPNYRGQPVDNDRGLCFTGLFGMIDPPRPSVPSAVMTCQSAGIRVIMVTGDHPVTAHAIAKQVNIVKRRKFYQYELDNNGRPKQDEEGRFKVIRDKKGSPKFNYKKDKRTNKWLYNRTREEAAEELGKELDDVTDKEYEAVVVSGTQLNQELELSEESQCRFWNRVLSKPDCVFARTSPQQKLIIVSAVQERGGIVAVTGDGVNDSPALKKADIGVAMGMTGTEVAKESADMILADDNFASIVNGVEEGRIIFDNLKKSIAYTLSSNIPEILPFLLYQTIRIPLPLIPIMILLVDLGTDLVPAISLAHENKEADIMKRLPRDPDVDKLVTWRLVSFSYLQIGTLQALAGVYAYMCVLATSGLRPEFLQGLAITQYFDQSANQNIRRDGYLLYCTMDTACNYKMDDDFFFTDANNERLPLADGAGQCIKKGTRANPEGECITDLSSIQNGESTFVDSASCRSCVKDTAAKVAIETPEACAANANEGCSWNGETGTCQNSWRLFSPTYGVGGLNTMNPIIQSNDEWTQDTNPACFFLPPFPDTEAGQDAWFTKEGVPGAGQAEMNQFGGSGCSAEATDGYGLPNSVCYGVQGNQGNWGFANVYAGSAVTMADGTGVVKDSNGNEKLFYQNASSNGYFGTVSPARGLGYHQFVQKKNGSDNTFCEDLYKAAEVATSEAIQAGRNFVEEPAVIYKDKVIDDGQCNTLDGDGNPVFKRDVAAAAVKKMYLNAYKLRYNYENQIYKNRDCKERDVWGFDAQTFNDSPFYKGDEENGPLWQIVKEDANGDAEFRPGCDQRSSTGNPEAAEKRIPGAFRTENYEMFPITMLDRELVLRQANTAYFISIIVVQWADLMICKTRFNSLFMQGMSNMFMNWGLIFETALGATLVYLPIANIATETRPLTFAMWTPAIPFCALIFFYDEFRKYWIREHRHGWLERNTYW